MGLGVFMRVSVNDGGFTVGQDHHKSKLSDTDVDLMRDLHEDSAFSYTKLAWIFTRKTKTKISKLYVRDICTYRRRDHIPTGSKEKPKAK